MKKHVVTFLKFVFIFSLLTWIVRSDRLDFQLLWSEVTAFDIFIGFVLIFLNVFINNFRWYLLARSQGIEMSFWESIQLTWIGLFFNYAVPGGVGGDVIKGYYLVRDQHKNSRIRSAMSIFLDRILGLFGISFTASLTMAIFWSRVETVPELRKMAFILLLINLGFVFVMAASFSKIIRKFLFQERFHKIPGMHILHQVSDALYSYKQHPRVLIYSVMISVVSHFAIVVFYYYTAQAMGFPGLPFYTFLFVVPIGTIALAIPIAPAGLGVGQVAFSYLYQWTMGRNTALGANSVTLLQIYQFLLSLFGLYFYLQRKAPVLKEDC